MNGAGPLALQDGSGGKQGSPEPLKVSCGGAHTLFIRSLVQRDEVEHNTVPGQVCGWGNNSWNQLGTGDRLVPKPQALKEEAEKADDRQQRLPTSKFSNAHIYEVACGKNHSALLQVDAKEHDGTITSSKVWTSGLAANGRLGTGKDSEEGSNLEEVRFPKPQGGAVLGDMRFVVQRICCGSDHTLALCHLASMNGASVAAGGRIFAWGLGSYGALGIKARTSALTPTEVWFPEDQFDDNPEGCLRYQRMVMVTAGVKHSMALSDTGRLYTWGHGGHGRLGHGKVDTRMGDSSFLAQFEPKEVKTEALDYVTLRWIAAGEGHSAAVDTLGGLYTWGEGSCGRCGNGVSLAMGSPMRVEAFTGIAIDKVSLGLLHSVAMTVKGQLWGWGKGPATGLDIGDAVRELPAEISLPGVNLNLNPVYQVSCGPLHTVVATLDGTIFYFGSATEGRMVQKDGSTAGRMRDICAPKRLDDIQGWNAREMRPQRKDERAEKAQSKRRDKWWPQSVAAGGSHSAVVTESGDLWLWGSKMITSTTEVKEEDVSAAGASSEDGTWKPCLQKRGLPEKVSLISIGQEHCLAILGAGSGSVGGPLYAWGSGQKGQLGTGNLVAVQPTPMQVSNVMVVIHCAAGEAHSACVGESGELFTWGEALGGRLGLGSTQSEGLEMLPKQARIRGKFSTDVRLRSVACGSQHTAFISSDHGLLSCGNGWYGRLGLGKTANAYEPQYVSFEGASDLKVLEVKCAQYHTCIRDEDNILWITGRDQCVCGESGEHVLAPQRFAPFYNAGVDPVRIKLMALAEQHTLAVSMEDEVFVWGVNSRGQLGLPKSEAPIISPPWQLRPVRGEEWKKHDHIIGVATANAHSLILIEHGLRKAERRKDKERLASAPDTYAWGYAAGGRLGIKIDGDEDAVDGMQLKLVTAMNGEANNDVPRQLRTYGPKKVQDEWRPEDDEAIAKQRQLDDDDDDLGQDKNHWYELQRKLHAEPEDHKPAKLNDLQFQVDKTYRKFMEYVFKLWDKPDQKHQEQDKVEWHLRKKEREIEIEYIRNLRVLDLGNSVSAPRLEGRLHTPKRIRQNLHNFEELVWIMQQQPMYLSNLAKRIYKKRNDEDEPELFRLVVTQLFDELKDDRTLSLFKALLRVLVKFEMDKAPGPKELFHPDTSRILPLMTHIATNPAFMKRIALPIIDPDDENSLIHNVIKYSISKDWDGPRQQTEKLEGIFCFDQSEYARKLEEHRKEQQQEDMKDDKKVRQYFQNELKDMAEFFCVEGHGRESTLKNIKCMDAFLRYFIEDKLAEDVEECKDVQMLLVFMAKHLYGQRYIVQFKRTGESPSDEYYEPIAAIVLAGIIAGVLKAIESGMFALFNKKIGLKVEEMEGEMLVVADRQRKEKKYAKDAERDPGLQSRVKYNIRALANFFERAVHHARGTMEKDAEAMARQLRELACRSLAKKLEFALDSSGQRVRKEGSKDFATDTTETQLTVSLYKAHFSLKHTRVWIKEFHMLKLTNMLQQYMEPDLHDGDTQIRLDKANSDRVCQLVTEILGKDKKQRFSDEDLALSERHGDYHNFTMKGRFLEFHREEHLYEPTFCEDSQAPIPRFLAKTEQKSRQGVRAVKPFRNHERGPPWPVDMAILGTESKQAPFEYLEELFQELSGSGTGQSATDRVKYRILGKSYPDLKASFEEIQAEIATSIEEAGGHAHATSSGLLQKLGHASRLVERLRESLEEKELRDYIDKTMQKRSDYYRYLKDIQDGIDKIEDSHKKYIETVKNTAKYLEAVYKQSKECDIPEDIDAMAQTHSAMPTLNKAKRRKNVYQKKHETPAQKVLNELSRTMGDGAVTNDVLERIGSPACSFDLKQLINKGVVVRVHDKISASVQKKMVFNFRYEAESYEVQVYMKPATLLKSFSITREHMHLMGAGRKTSILPYGDDFIWIHCFRLRRLLGQIAADTEL